MRNAWRPVVGALLVILLAGAWVELRQAETSARDSARGVARLQAALTGLADGPLPDVARVPAGTSGQVRAYAGLLEAVVKRLPSAPALYRPPVWARVVGSLGAYDRAAADCKEAYAQAQGALADARVVTQHEAAVMNALTNPLDYPVAMDLVSDDPVAVTPASKAAVTGLNSAADKVKGLETRDDPTLAQVRDRLATARKAFQGLLDVVGTPGQAAVQPQTLAAMQAAQTAILADRAAYSDTQNRRLGAGFAKAAADLRPCAEQMGRIQFSQ